MTRNEYYPMDYEAWDAGTFELTIEEEGAYLRLIHQMYRRQQPVANNPKFLAHMWRCHVNKAKVILQRLIDLGKIVLTSDNLLRNVRVEHELEMREERRKKKVDAGRVGGRRSADVRTTHPPYYDVAPPKVDDAPPYADHPDTKHNDFNAENEALSTKVREKKGEEDSPPTPLRGECELTEFEKARKTAQRKAIANAKRKKAPPRTRIPPDFKPDEKTRAFIDRLEFIKLDDLVTKFVARMRNKGEVSIDWQERCRQYADQYRENEQKFATRGFGFGAPDEEGRPCIGIGDDGLPRYRGD